MRSESESESKILWKEATIVFDTNVLLGIHSWPEEKSRWLIGELRRKPLNRIWIPHQVALEFTRNRTVRLNDRIRTIDRIKVEIEGKIKSARTSITQTLKNNRIEVDETNFPETENILSNWVKPYIDTLINEKNKLIPRLELDSDIIFYEFEELFRGKIGQPMEYDEELEIYHQGSERYAQKIPPGYMDEDAKHEPWRKYGDLVLWTQIIKHASTDNVKAVILVTNDAKEDWIEENGRANPLLKQEFSRKTGGKRFLLLNLDDFIREAIKHRAIRDNSQTKRIAVEAQRDVEDAARELKLSRERIPGLQENFRRDFLGALGPAYSSVTGGIPGVESIAQTVERFWQEDRERLQRLREAVEQSQKQSLQILQSSSFLANPTLSQTNKESNDE